MPVPRDHVTAERRSLAYHRLVAERLDETVRARAKATLARWSQDGAIAEPYANRWRHVLDLPLPDLARAMTADDESGRDLRQCTPFAGVVGARERWRIIREVR